MRVLYFDTETTGLYPAGNYVDGHMYPGQICQLAYLIDDGAELIAKNFYFAVEYIDPNASRVTGLTVPLVEELSGGRRFADDVDEINADFASADLVVAHNLSFDEKFMRVEMARCGYSFDLGDKGWCSMKGFTPILKLPGTRNLYKYPSLAELGAYWGIEENAVKMELELLYRVDTAAHDARYDTVKMYLAIQRAIPQVEGLKYLFGKEE